MAEAERLRDEARELLRGAVDLHVHTSPDVFKRKANDLETVAAAKAAGLGALILKSHHTLTADRAQIAREVVGMPVFGGLVLNHYVVCTQLQARPVPIAEFAGLIREIGTDRCVLSTDGGQPGNPPPIDMSVEMVASLLAEGITPAEIRRMAVETSSALLNL